MNRVKWEIITARELSSDCTPIRVEEHETRNFEIVDNVLLNL